MARHLGHRVMLVSIATEHEREMGLAHKRVARRIELAKESRMRECMHRCNVKGCKAQCVQPGTHKHVNHLCRLHRDGPDYTQVKMRPWFLKW